MLSVASCCISRLFPAWNNVDVDLALFIAIWVQQFSCQKQAELNFFLQSVSCITLTEHYRDSGTESNHLDLLVFEDHNCVNWAVLSELLFNGCCPQILTVFSFVILFN